MVLLNFYILNIYYMFCILLSLLIRSWQPGRWCRHVHSTCSGLHATHRYLLNARHCIIKNTSVPPVALVKCCFATTLRTIRKWGLLAQWQGGERHRQRQTDWSLWSKRCGGEQGIRERPGSGAMSPTEQRVGEKGAEEEERSLKNTVFCSRHVKFEAQVTYLKWV